MCNLTQLAVHTGRDICRVRMRLAWTQKRLARILSIGERTLQGWEENPDKELPEGRIKEINQIFRRQAEELRRPGLLALPWDERLARIRCLVLKHSRVVLNGMPGVGKTFLAQQLFQDETIQQHFSTRIQCPVGTKADELRVLWLVLHELGESPCDANSSEKNRNALKDRLKEIDENRNALKDRLKEIDGRILIMLDDVWRLEQVAGLIDVLNGLLSKPIGLLVTTRDCKVGSSIVGAEPECSVCVEVMSEEDSLDLLQRRVRILPSPEEEQLMELARTLEHLPLSLIVAAGLMNAGKPVENLCRYLCDRAFLESPAPLDAARSSLWHEAPTIRALLDLSYEALPEEVQECYRACCALRTEACSMMQDSLTAQWPEIEDPQPVIDLLVQRGLLETAVHERDQRMYRIHDLIRMHMEYRAGLLQ